MGSFGAACMTAWLHDSRIGNRNNACNDAINVTPPGATDKNSRLIRLYLLSKEPVPATSNSKSRTNYRSVHVKDNQNDKFDAFIQTYGYYSIHPDRYYRKISLIRMTEIILWLPIISTVVKPTFSWDASRLWRNDGKLGWKECSKKATGNFNITHFLVDELKVACL